MADGREELVHAAREEVDVLLRERVRTHVARQLVDGAAHVDDAADHADARTLAEHGVKRLAVPAADDGAAAAHELERERADVLEDPELRLLVERVVLHQRARARAGAAADVDAAARRAVARRVARVAAHGDEAARVEPADIGRRGLIDDDLRAGQAHGADALAGVRHVEMQRLAVRIPERAADVMLTGGRDLELRLAVLDGLFDGQEEVLRGHALMAFHCLYLKHALLPLLHRSRRGKALGGSGRPRLPSPALATTRNVAESMPACLHACFRARPISRRTGCRDDPQRPCPSRRGRRCGRLAASCCRSAP